MDDLISRQAAIDAIDVLCQEHRYRIPGKAETYSQYNEAWQDALDRAEGAIGNVPSAQPEIIICLDCVHYEPLGKEKAWGRCSVHSSPTDNQRFVQSCDFCAWAERRTDE